MPQDRRSHADLTPASVSRELEVLLQDARYRDAAATIAAEIAAMPPAGDAVPALTALADGPPASLEADDKPMTE